MEDLKPLIYIVIGIIWFVGSAYRKAQQQKQVKQIQPPQTIKPQQETEKKKDVNPPARSIDEMLKEILEGKRPQPQKKQQTAQTVKPQPKQIVPRQPRQVEKKPLPVAQRTKPVKKQPQTTDLESKAFLKAHEEGGHKSVKAMDFHDKKVVLRPVMIAGKHKFDPKLAMIYAEIMKPKFMD